MCPLMSFDRLRVSGTPIPPLVVGRLRRMLVQSLLGLLDTLRLLVLSRAIGFLLRRRNSQAAESPKERLFYGWYVVAAGVAGFFAIAITTTESLSIYISPVAEEFQWSRTLVSGSVALGTLLCAPFSFVVGPLIDRYGARWVVAAAAFVIGLGFLGMTVAREPVGFYAAVTLTRVGGVGLIGLAVTTAVANWFIVKRGRAVAIATLGASLSTIFVPLLAQVVIETYSWRTSLVMLSLLVWGVAITPALLFMKRRPEDVGLLPDGASRPAAASKDTPPRPAVAYRSEQTDHDWTLPEAIRTPAMWLLVVTVPLSIMVLGGTTLHQTAYLIERGLAPVAAAGALSFFAIGTGVSRLVWGFLSERYPVRLSMAAGALFMALGQLLLLNAQTSPVAFAASLMLGIGTSGAISLEPVIYANYFGRLHLGRIRGFSSIFRWGTAASGPLLSGVAYDLADNYLGIYLTYMIVMMAVTGLMAVTLPPKRRTGVSTRMSGAS